jgi:hypothetical protein
MAENMNLKFSILLAVWSLVFMTIVPTFVVPVVGGVFVVAVASAIHQIRQPACSHPVGDLRLITTRYEPPVIWEGVEPDAATPCTELRVWTEKQYLCAKCGAEVRTRSWAHAE